MSDSSDGASARLTTADVERVAQLSRLNFDAEATEGFRVELGKCLDYIGLLNEVDTEGVKPTSHPLPLSTAFREDAAETSLTREEALANAPETDGESFVVPKVVG